MTVRYTRRAQRDLTRILDTIAKDTPQGSRNVMHALERATRTIERFPRCGYRAGHGNALGLTVTPYPYIFYWVVEGNDAHIVHIRHGARRGWKEER
ncbi:MAG: type II toxin-antitoxin system RelE/ParE family toxin [Beijerinckiaceae bacterium]|nr:type II toxin-antitoxin system RelE/ParE family toxin [Beijerinckiaceae bacterium]